MENRKVKILIDSENQNYTATAGKTFKRTVWSIKQDGIFLKGTVKIDGKFYRVYGYENSITWSFTDYQLIWSVSEQQIINR